MKQRISLYEWARRNGYSRSAAYRHFHNGTLPEGVRATKHGNRIYVDINTLDDLDPHALAHYLKQHGYYLLTTSEAEQLGIGGNHEPPQPTQPAVPD